MEGAALHKGLAGRWRFAPSRCGSECSDLLGHLADHVVEDAPVVEISELHVGVEPHDGLESLPGVQL